LWSGLGAYGLWGVIPFYFRQVMHVPPLETLSHRVVWCMAALAVLLTWNRRWHDVRAVVLAPPTLGRLAASAALIGLNWLAYINAVATERIVDASLGYFITPLVSVMMGVLFLAERLRPWRAASVMLALAGVGLLVWHDGLPWISLTLALSFSTYGLVRKTTRCDSLTGLFVETLWMLPAGLTGVILTSLPSSTPLDGWTWCWLALGGPVTAAPLLLFVYAAKRLPLSTIGFLQFVTPSVQFLLAVLLFGEPMSVWRFGSFTLVWSAVGVFLLGIIREELAASRPGQRETCRQTPPPAMIHSDTHGQGPSA
jgi:chloramphenicol-sensitive protein RarD